MAQLIKNFIHYYTGTSPLQLRLYAHVNFNNIDENAELVSVIKNLAGTELECTYRVYPDPGKLIRKATLVDTIPWSGTPYKIVTKLEDAAGVPIGSSDSMDTAGAPLD